MSSPASIALIKRAREGDREAREELFKRYYPRWKRQFHGRLGDRLKRVYDTEDLIQSALVDAFEHGHELRDETAFFSWVSAIVGRKLIDVARRERRRVALPLDIVPEPTGDSGSDLQIRVESEEEYVRLLDSIIESFSIYPENMSVFYLRYLEGLGISDLVEIFGRSVRSVHRSLYNACGVLRSKLG